MEKHTKHTTKLNPMNMDFQCNANRLVMRNMDFQRMAGCNSIKEEAAVSIDEVDIPAGQGQGQGQGRVLHRVPPQLRENKKHLYDPTVLSLGPYHHGRTHQFHLAEKVKDKAVDIICGGRDKGFLLSKIGERVEEIRHYFGAEACSSYSDEELAEMMLHDACFVIFYMETIGPIINSGFFRILADGLGISGLMFLSRDFFMLENQIPLWFIKLVFSLINDGDEERFRTLLCNCLAINVIGGNGLMRLPWEEEPLHLLEAKILISLIHEAREERVRKPEDLTVSTLACTFGTVTDLKAKGIHFGPSSYCLKDIKFFSPKLQLPIILVNNNTQAFLSNAIAFEMSPGSPLGLSVTSYVKFMKMLIGDAKDAKELREKGILFNCLGSDEDVVRVFQGVDTYGFHDGDLFFDVKACIEKHCNSKGKTWMAELLSTYFRSPWKAIAVFAAFAMLSLTFLQTYYTIHSP